jgi:hypothetical protein
MRQRKLVEKKPSVFAQLNPVNFDEMFFNLADREWLKRQGAWREARDTTHFGINSFEEYVAESRAHGRDLMVQTDFERFLEELKRVMH